MMTTNPLTTVVSHRGDGLDFVLAPDSEDSLTEELETVDQLLRLGGGFVEAPMALGSDGFRFRMRGALDEIRTYRDGLLVLLDHDPLRIPERWGDVLPEEGPGEWTARQVKAARTAYLRHHHRCTATTRSGLQCKNIALHWADSSLCHVHDQNALAE